MPQFIKLTRVTGWKVGEDKKKVATETQPVYIRPSEIISFADDDGYTYIALSHDVSITVTEKADDIYNLVSQNKDDGYKRYDKYFREGIDGNKTFFDDDFWWSKPFKAEWTSRDTFEKLNSNTPYYGYAIVFGNGEVWE